MGMERQTSALGLDLCELPTVPFVFHPGPPTLQPQGAACAAGQHNPASGIPAFLSPCPGPFSFPCLPPFPYLSSCLHL